MQIKPYTGRSIILMILFPLYPFFKNVIFAHEIVHDFFVYEFMFEFARKFVKEIFINFVHKFMYIMRPNSYEFFAQKNGCSKGLYCR